MLRITPEHGTFRVARQVTFDARRRFPRTAGGLGCSATISRSQRELVPLLSLQSIAITQSRIMAKDDPRLPLLEKQARGHLPRGDSAVGAVLEGDRRQGHHTTEDVEERFLVEFGAVHPDIGIVDALPLAFDESPSSPGSQRAGMPSQS